MRSAGAVGDDWLLAEADHVLEVVGLGRVGPSGHVLRVEHERTRGIVRTATEVELLWFAILWTVSRAYTAPRCRVEIDQIPRRKVHILHIRALLIAQVRRRYVHVLSVTGDRALEDKLRVGYVRGARVLRLIALVLIPSLWLFALDGVGAVALGVDERQLLLIGESVGQDLLPGQLRRDQLHRAALGLAAAARREVLQADLLRLLLVTHLTVVHLGELVLRHLHQLPLILNLPLRQLKCLARHRVARDDLRGVLTGHEQILLRLFVLEVRVGRGRLLELVVLVELQAVLQLLLLLLLHRQKLAIRWYAVALVPDLAVDWAIEHVLLVIGRVGHELRVIIRAAEVQIAVAGQLRNRLGLPLARRCHYHAREILVLVPRLLRRLVVVRRRAVIAAGLVPGRLLHLVPVEQLVLRLVSGVAAVQVVGVLVGGGEDFGPVLRRDDLLLLLGEHGPVLLGGDHGAALDVVHLQHGRLRDLLLRRLDSRHSHHALVAGDPAVRRIVETDKSVATSIAVELGGDLDGRTAVGAMPMVVLLLLQLVGGGHAGRVCGRAGHLHDEAARLLTLLLCLALSTGRRHLERHDQLVIVVAGTIVSCVCRGSLLLLDQLVLDHPLDVLRVVLRDISDAFVSGADEALESEVVARGERVVLVRLDQAAGVLARALIERILFKDYLELAEVDGDRVLPDYDARVVFDVFDLAEPGVGADVRRGEALGRVRVQDPLHQVAAVVAHELRDRVIRIEDLLVEHVGLRVLERQVAADHGVENDTA